MPEKNKSSKAPSKHSGPLSVYYDKLVAKGEIQDDKAQRTVVQALEKLCAELAVPAGGALGKLFKKEAASRPGGIYIWGTVGRGKSMLMDLFYDHVPVKAKRHIHFHAFMQEVHNRIHQLRQDGQRDKSGVDPVALLAQQIAQETNLLCFDELQATDVADATLLHRLFSGLFDAGTVIVSTSNHPPASLYTGGVQRERFAKFTALIESRMRVVSLVSPLDYRHSQLKSMEKRYFSPLGPAADAFISDVIGQLCADPHPHSKKLTIKGRTLTVTMYDGDVGRFTFQELCEKALGAADYLELAKHCDTLILTGIPELGPEKRNEAKRFVTLIDALYEQRVMLLCTAAVPPEELYSEGDGAFEFKRTVSRLAEMQSIAWDNK